MKKTLWISLLAVVLLAAVVISGAVYAQTDSPNGNAPEDGLGLYHDEILAAFSDALDIPVDALEARLAEGETMVQIALAEGMTLEDIRALMPTGMFAGTRGGGRHGRGSAMMDGQFLNGDSNCLEPGTCEPHYLENQLGTTRGSRGGGRWNR